MMRTARATVHLDPRERPLSLAAMEKARQALHTLTSVEPSDRIRFTGYQPGRVACYEADYPDDTA